MTSGPTGPPAPPLHERLPGNPARPADGSEPRVQPRVALRLLGAASGNQQ